MRQILTGLFVWLCGVTAALAQTSLPLDKGLPVHVKVGVAYVDVSSFDENAPAFEATVDVRLRWEDLRLRRPPAEAGDPPRVYRGEDAANALKTIWAPDVDVANLITEARRVELGLRIFPNGGVELLKRVSGTFGTEYDVSSFPFGKQQLQVQLALQRETANQVQLAFDQDDLDFSRTAVGAKLDGWGLRFINLSVNSLPGWYGASHAGVTASLEAVRNSGPIIASIFVPLLASLLIPLLTIWLNRAEGGSFEIETFELVNIIIGGLFAVIALNFTVNSVYEVLESGDNPINRLFALNYVTLAVCLAINVMLYRFSVVERVFGAYVQEQFYQFLVWAVPLLVLTMATAIIFVAIA